jgi:hypothetical protein
MSKPEQTDFIATCAHGWGCGLEADLALYAMLQNVGDSEGRKGFEMRILEVSRDWTINGFGDVRATYINVVATGKISHELKKAAKSVHADLLEAIEYKDEAVQAA